ncbi:unnamed protein product [Absidia cylindrospora]
MNDTTAENEGTSNNLLQQKTLLERRFQHFLDEVTPFAQYRWIATAVLLVLFMLRIILAEGWYIVTYSVTKATAIALFCSFFRIFDIPVYWPILLVYFCVLFAITMRRQIKHMVKYRYIPFDLNKRQYASGSSNRSK